MIILASCFLILQAVTLIKTAPTEIVPTEPGKPDCKNDVTTDVYDQSQNGTENFRINLKGVVIVVAPPEVAMAAAASSLASSGNNDDNAPLRPPEVEDHVNCLDGGKCTTYAPTEQLFKERARKKFTNIMQMLNHFKRDSQR